MSLFSSSSDDQTRYNNAIAYLQNQVDAGLANLVLVGMTHNAIATGNGKCIGVRQPGSSGGVTRVNIANCPSLLPVDPNGETILVCTCNPTGMENR